MITTYVILVLIFMALIVLAVICGKKLRDFKDARTLAEITNTSEETK